MIKAYFPSIEEVSDSAFFITPEIAKKLEPYTRQNSLDAGDNVNHPKHYNSHPSGIEAITIAEHFSFSLGNVIKYIFRAGLKENNVALTDLKKAKFYLDHEIERLSK